MKFSIKDFFIKCEQICSFLWNPQILNVTKLSVSVKWKITEILHHLIVIKAVFTSIQPFFIKYYLCGTEMKLEKIEPILKNCFSFVALSLNWINEKGEILETIRDPLQIQKKKKNNYCWTLEWRLISTLGL